MSGIRHEYKGVVRRHWELHENIAAGVARLAQYESGDGWDLVSFSIVSLPTDGSPDHQIHVVFRRDVSEKRSNA